MELLLFLVTLFLLGAAHALEPGHGKLLVTSYLVGEQANTRDAVLLGGLVALFHTLSVAFIGAVVILFALAFFKETLLQFVEVISGAIILGLGLLLFWRRFLCSSEPDDHCDCHLTHTHHESAASVRPSQGSLKEVIWLGIASGVTPCPVALAALISAFSMGYVLHALGALTVFSLGLGAVLVVIGLALVHGSHQLSSVWQRRFERAPVVITKFSTILILLLGVYLVSKPFVFPEHHHHHATEGNLFLSILDDKK